jgi:hypothetical protein
VQQQFQLVIGFVLGTATLLAGVLVWRGLRKLKNPFTILTEIRDLLAKQQAEPVGPGAISDEDRQALLAIPKLVEGWIEISKEQVAQTAKLVEAVTAFRKTLFRSEGGDFTESSEAEASREYEIQQILKERGGDREHAEGILDNRSLWEGMKLR